MIKPRLNKLKGSKWSGRGELWLDPEGNNAELYDCKLVIDSTEIHYTWLYESDTQKGSFTFTEKGAIWVDSWHQAKSVQCKNAAETESIFNVSHHYEVPENPNWGWLSKLSERPDGSLVLQMTNITPWGEDGRAVRMVFTRAES